MITIEPPSSPALSAALSLSKPGLTRFLTRARTAAGLPGQVDVLLTSDAELKRLNRAYRGKNKATDVLSFPTPPEIAPIHAGDLAISLDTAARQAATFGHSLDIEVRVLLLHGLLHLSGLDHETDTGEMATREAELRTKLKLPVSLIDRVTNRKPGQIVPKKKPAKKKSTSRRVRA
jgi:probable rRNA maturation factor